MAHRAAQGGHRAARIGARLAGWLAIVATALALGALGGALVSSFGGCAPHAADGRQLVVRDPEGCGLGWTTCTIARIADCGAPPGEGVTPGEVIAYSACVAVGVQACHAELSAGACARVPIGEVVP